MSFDPMQMNYTALNARRVRRSDFTKEELKKAHLLNPPASRPKDVMGVELIIMGLVGLGLPAWFFLVMAIVGSIRTGSVLVAIGLITLIVFIFSSIYLFVIIPKHIRNRNYHRQLRLYRFSLDNHLLYNDVESFSIPMEPVLFRLGVNTQVENRLTFPDGSYLWEYQYSYEIDNRKGLYYNRRLQVFATKLPYEVPHLILNSRENSVRPPKHDYYIDKIKLEGNFNQFFELYIPTKHHIDAMQILTPDVMMVLMRYGGYFDFEMVGRNLYVYADTIRSNWADKYSKLLIAGTQVAKEVGEQASVYGRSQAQTGVATTDTTTTQPLRRAVRLRPKPSLPRFLRNYLAILVLSLGTLFFLFAFDYAKTISFFPAIAIGVAIVAIFMVPAWLMNLITGEGGPKVIRHIKAGKEKGSKQ
jgi:hypothetical protein